MEVDLHFIETDKSVDELKKVLQEEIFGNYDVVNTKPDKYEFGIFMFKYSPQSVILKLDYSFYNYNTVSKSIMEALGKALHIDRYFIVGMQVDFTEAFIRFYKRDGTTDSMVMSEEIKNEDGIALTPIAKDKWNIDVHDIWGQMQERFNMEVARQRINESRDNGEGKSFVINSLEIHWKDKYGSMDNLDKPLCETMFFIARQEIEQYRADPTKIKVEKVKMGRIVLEQIDDEPTIRRVIPN